MNFYQNTGRLKMFRRPDFFVTLCSVVRTLIKWYWLGFYLFDKYEFNKALCLKKSIDSVSVKVWICLVNQYAEQAFLLSSQIGSACQNVFAQFDKHFGFAVFVELVVAPCFVVGNGQARCDCLWNGGRGAITLREVEASLSRRFCSLLKKPGAW